MLRGWWHTEYVVGDVPKLGLSYGKSN